MAINKLNIPNKTDNAAKKKMVQSNTIGANETLLANEVNALVAKTNELVDAYNFGAPITAFNFKTNVPTYADLPLVGNEVNDGYGVIADGLVYVWNGTAFPPDGDGMNVGLKPAENSKVDENNLLAVSGKNTFNGISNALDLSTDFVIKDVVPEDRSSLVPGNQYNTTAYYFEGANHNGAAKLYINAIESGVVSIAIITTVTSVGSVVESVNVNVVTGVNMFVVSTLGFTPSNLNLPNFVLGVSPSNGDLLPFQTSTTGALKVMAKSNGAITTTTHRGCSWVEIEKTPYLVQDYPKTKTALQQTINRENTFLELNVPYEKGDLTLTVNGNPDYLYGDAETFYSLENDLQDLKFKSEATGFVNVYFVNIIGNTVEILHTTQVSAVVGINTFSKSQLNAPTAVDNKPIYVFVGNENEQTPNVIQGGSGNPNLRPYYTLRISNSSLTGINGYTRFNHWLTVLEPTNKLVAEVDRLTQIVGNLPETTEDISIYDYKTNAPILPCDIFIDEAKPTPLFKNSLFQKFVGQNLPSVKFITNKKTFDVQDPTYIKHSDVGTTARIVIDKHTEPNTILYKILNILKFSSNGKTGEITIHFVTDSLGEGGAGFTSSPIYILSQQLQAMGITVTGIGTLQRTSGAITQRYEGHGGWRYRTFVGLEPKFSGLNVVIPDANRNVWVEGTDGNMNTIKSNNPYLYEATPQDLIDFPQWCFHFVSGATTNNVRYSENPNLGTYHIFSPARYFSERSIEFPDIVNIALGTNEWYLGGFSGWDLALIKSCADWMIQRFIDAVPSTTAILVTTCNNMPLTRENEWQEKASLLTSAILKIVETKKQTHGNLYGLSIFAHGSRQLAFNRELSSANLSEDNTTKVAVVDADVHVLNIDDEGRSDYIEALKTAVLYFV